MTKPISVAIEYMYGMNFNATWSVPNIERKNFPNIKNIGGVH